MALKVQCPSSECGKLHNVPNALAGKSIPCPDCGTEMEIQAAEKPAPKKEPDTIANYTLLRKLGEGGMGAVYEAQMGQSEFKVAIKILSKQLSDDPANLERFMREARNAEALSHPNIIQIFEDGEDQGRQFFAMELVDGGSLQQRLEREGKLPLHEALRIVEAVALALQYAHKQSIVHRDIKPDNILLSLDGQVKLVDLGLSKAVAKDIDVTATGMGLGTPHYMAPEQATDARGTDYRADIYSLGITFLRALSGKLPFDGKTSLDIIKGHMSTPLPSGKDLGTELPQAVEDVIQKMCAKKPEERYPDYDSLIAELAKLKELKPMPVISDSQDAPEDQPPVEPEAADEDQSEDKDEDKSGQAATQKSPTAPTIILREIEKAALAAAEAAKKAPKESEPRSPAPEKASPPPEKASPPPEKASPPPEKAPPPPEKASPPPEKASPPPEKASPPPEKASPPPEKAPPPPPKPTAAEEKPVEDQKPMPDVGAQTAATIIIKPGDIPGIALSPPPAKADKEKKKPEIKATPTPPPPVKEAKEEKKPKIGAAPTPPPIAAARKETPRTGPQAAAETGPTESHEPSKVGLRIVCIGAGNFLNSHTLLLLSKHNVKRVAISNAEEDRARLAQLRFGFSTFYMDFRKMLDAERPDAVFCVGPHQMRHEAGLEVLDRGLPLHLPQPHDSPLDAIKELAARAEEKGAVCHVGLNLRSAPTVLKARAIIQDQEFGTPLLAVFRLGLSPDEDLRTTVHRQHGPIVDLARYLLGDVREVTVHKSELEAQAHIIMLRFESGAIASLNFTPSQEGGPWYEIASKGARLAAGGLDQITYYRPKNGTPESVLSPSHVYHCLPDASLGDAAILESHGHKGDLTNFLAAAKGEEDCSPIASSIKTLELLEEILRQLQA